MLETKAKPLVCRQCGAVLRMKPGWLIRIGVFVSVITQITSHRYIHQRGLRVAVVTLVIIFVPLLIYPFVAPAERLDD
jgi:hypothetical protein